MKGGGIVSGIRFRLTDWQPLMIGKTPISKVTVRNFQGSNLVKSKFESQPIGNFYLNIYLYIYILYINITYGCRRHKGWFGMNRMPNLMYFSQDFRKFTYNFYILSVFNPVCPTSQTLFLVSNGLLEFLNWFSYNSLSFLYIFSGNIRWVNGKQYCYLRMLENIAKQRLIE